MSAEGFQWLYGEDVKKLIKEENRPPILVTLNKEEKKVINKELQDLLRAGVITLSKHEEGEFISGIFARQKSDGTYRMILNPKEIF